MKVLLINNHHFEKGGAHSVYFNTGRLLQEKGHQVAYYSMQTPEMEPVEFSELFPRLTDFRSQSFLGRIGASGKFVYNKEASSGMGKLLDRMKPDIAHVHLFMGGLTVSVLRTLHEHRIPVVHSVHDYRLICPAYLFLNGKGDICEKCRGGKYFQCTLRRCSENNLGQSGVLSLDAYFRHFVYNPARYIDTLLFVSHFARKKHAEYHFGTGIRSHVLHNFIPGLQQKSPMIERGHYFLYFGRLSREKGILTLIDAIKETGQNLIIAGDGPMKGVIELEKTENIKLKGFVKGLELENLIRGASFVVIPSGWYENNPMALLEAYAWGKPVIGSRIGGIPEIVSEGETGYLFTSKDKNSLIRALEKAEKTESSEYSFMSGNARKFADASFDPDSYYTNLVNLYKETINN